jgi:hypothetical protein
MHAFVCWFIHFQARRARAIRWRHLPNAIIIVRRRPCRRLPERQLSRRRRTRRSFRVRTTTSSQRQRSTPCRGPATTYTPQSPKSIFRLNRTSPRSFLPPRQNRLHADGEQKFEEFPKATELQTTSLIGARAKQFADERMNERVPKSAARTYRQIVDNALWRFRIKSATTFLVTSLQSTL